MFFAGTILAFGFSSCSVLNRYQTPEVKTENLYRRDTAVKQSRNASDTTTVADIPWRAYFTDNNLIALIEEGLQHNADLQVAVLNIRQAEAQLNMARAAYFPDVSLVGQVTNLSTSNASRAFSHNANDVSPGIAV